MIRMFYSVLLITLLIGVQPLLAEEETPDNIRNNQYFMESLRLAGLAQEAYDDGDYDAAADYAREAARYAELSDAYIAQQMKTTDEGTYLPASYTVRDWDVSGDCFWNIAGRPWAYGDPHQWRLLYDANRSKLPDPNNPNLIEPGTVLEIPSIRGEVRQGAWDEAKTYTLVR